VQFICNEFGNVCVAYSLQGWQHYSFQEHSFNFHNFLFLSHTHTAAVHSVAAAVILRCREHMIFYMSNQWMHLKSFTVSEIMNIIQEADYISDHTAGIKYTSF
jgi:hypothetical protein